MSKYGGFALKLCCYDQCILRKYSKPQVAEDQEGCQRRHKRPTSDDGAHDGATLALGSRPRQGLARVLAKREAWESHFNPGVQKSVRE